MYRSQLRLNVMMPSVRQGIADCNDMHRNLMRAFDLPDDESESQREKLSLLYRLTSSNGSPALYVLSSEKPDWSKVSGVEPINEPASIDRLKDILCEGACFRFNLFASPTRKISREGKLSSRVFLREQEKRVEWMDRHAAAAGFELVSCTEGNHSRIAGRKSGDRINYTGVMFDGILKIVDSSAFWEAYCKGIGPGKAYGLGMLMIARV